MRVKILVSIFEARQLDKGCGLNLRELMLGTFISSSSSLLLLSSSSPPLSLSSSSSLTSILGKCALAQFPIHDYDELKALQRKWLILFQFPWNQPIDHVKDYFGERIGIIIIIIIIIINPIINRHYQSSLS